MGKKVEPAFGSRLSAQAVVILSGPPPPNLKPVAGFLYAEGQPVPLNLQRISSLTLSLGSPLTRQNVTMAVLLFSLGSTTIPSNLKRVAIVI